MQKPTIIFDFDGTLADTIEGIWSIIDRVSPEYGLGYLTREDFEQARRSPHGLTGRAMRNVPRRSWWQLVRLARRVRDEQQRMVPRLSMPAGMREALAEVGERGWRMGILTTNRTVTARLFTVHHRLPEFHFIAGANDIMGKTWTLKRLVQRQRINPRTAVMVGDEVGDITAGKNVGMRTVAVTWGFHAESVLKHHQPDALIAHPHELLALLHVLFEKGTLAEL